MNSRNDGLFICMKSLCTFALAFKLSDDKTDRTVTLHSAVFELSL